MKRSDCDGRAFILSDTESSTMKSADSIVTIGERVARRFCK